MISVRVLDFGRTDTSYQAIYEPQSIYTRIELVKSGSARFIAGKGLALRKGSLGIFPPGTFRIEFPRRGYQSFFLHAIYLPVLTLPLVVPVAKEGTAGKLFNLLVSLPLGTDKAVVSKLAESLLLEVNRSEKFHSEGDSRMNRVMKHLVESEGRTTVAALAELAPLHPKYFMSAFKREFGVTVERSLARERLATARKFLASGSSIPKAALESGFENEKAFGRFFKRQTSLTPGAFRVMHQIPVIHVPRVAPVKDLETALWEKGKVLDRWFTIYEARPQRSGAISGQIMHDEKYLYVRLEERIDASRLVSDAVIHNGDDWEIVFGPRRSFPYRYLKAAPDGRVECLTREEGANKRWRRKIQRRVVKESRCWRVEVALPLSEIASYRGGRPHLFGNLYRQVFQGVHLALSSTISFSFHTPSRFASFVLE